jgi:hypothetical protein
MLNYPPGSQQASNPLDTGNSTALCPENEPFDSARDMTCFVSNPIQPHILASCIHPLIHSTLRVCSRIEDAPRNPPSGRVSRVSTLTHSRTHYTCPSHPIPSHPSPRVWVCVWVFWRSWCRRRRRYRRLAPDASCPVMLCCAVLCPLRCGRGRGCRCKCEKEEIVLAVSTLELLAASGEA